MLKNLREKYVTLSEQIEALEKAIEARRNMAKEMAVELEKAVLRGDNEEVKTLMRDLKAVDAAFQKDEEARLRLLEEIERVSREIQSFYDRALDEEGVTVDWNAVLEDGELYDGWGNRTYPGKIVLIEGAELCRPELEWLQTRIFQGCIVRQKGKRLQVEEPVYRDFVWADKAGEEIVRALLPLLPRSKVIQEVHRFLDELRVLK